MKKNLLKKIWLIMMAIFTISLMLPLNTYADENDLEVDGFNIMPELTGWQIDKIDQAIVEIWSTWWKVMEKYKQTAEGLKTSEQIASWIMTRNTIMDYLVFVVQFLSQLWLVVWAIFIMYAWYKYMISVFNNSKIPSETIKNAIIWVIIVIFSYAIMRILTSFIWLT